MNASNKKDVTQNVLVLHPTLQQTEKHCLCFLPWIRTLLSSLFILLSMRHQWKKNGKCDRGEEWHKKEEERKKCSITSEQYLLKNLSFKTNKDTIPELCLIVVAYFLHESVYNWEPIHSCFPTTGRPLADTLTFSYCTTTLHTQKQIQTHYTCTCRHTQK